MNAVMNNHHWYDPSKPDKYVNYMASMLDGVRKNGVYSAQNWLERVTRIKPRARWGLRRRFWLATVNLRYAELSADKAIALQIQKEARTIRQQGTDALARQMYEVLETDCMIALHKISAGHVSPFLSNAHKSLLNIVDNFMMLDENSYYEPAFLEDCNHLFDITSDVERIMGKSLYNNTTSDKMNSSVEDLSEVLPFYAPNSDKLADILDYLSTWMGERYDQKTHGAMKNLLAHVENAKHVVEKKLSICSESLFQQSPENESDLDGKIARARAIMLHELHELNERHDHPQAWSYWKLYLELVVQTSIQQMGLHKQQVSDKTIKLLRQVARWPLHEKMHRIIKSIARDSDHLKDLLSKGILNSESLLYGIFARLSMKSVDVLYSGFSITNMPEYSRDCHNGKGGGRVYSNWVPILYQALHDQLNQGYIIQLAEATGFSDQVMDYACVCTGHQLIILGLPKSFSLQEGWDHRGQDVLAELMELVGFRFNHYQAYRIEGPKTPETAVPKYRSLSTKGCYISRQHHFIDHYIEDEVSSDDIEEIKGFEENYLQQGHFEDMMSEVRTPTYLSW